MALYKVGDRLLDADEYYLDLIFKWKIALFAIGASVAGFAAYGFIPIDWEKWIKFGIVIALGVAGGSCLAFFARQIEALSVWALRGALLFIIGAIIWSFI